MVDQNPKDALRHMLRDITPAGENEYGLDLTGAPVAAARLQLPYMVLLTVLLGTDCTYEPRPSEKIAWTIHMRFRGVPFRLVYGKFGMHVASAEEPAGTLVNDLVDLLQRAFPVADRVLQPEVDVLLRAGKVTVPNRYHLFRQRYEFFRKRARETFDTPHSRLDDPPGIPEGGKPRSLDIFKSEREGFFYGSAAIDTYFSWLEHVLVLVLPFVGYDPANDDLVAFIGGSWTDKLKRIWDLPNDDAAKKLYDALRETKERFRNALAHGGFEKGDASLAVHIPGVGAVPTTMSRFAGSIHYGFFPLENTSLAEACALFDEVDSHLRSGRARFGMRYAESGLDVAFDGATRGEYSSAMSSDTDFDELIERKTYYVDMHANMDW